MGSKMNFINLLGTQFQEFSELCEYVNIFAASSIHENLKYIMRKNSFEHDCRRLEGFEVRQSKYAKVFSS